MLDIISFKVASEKDIPLIHELGEKIWRVHYPSIISQSQIEYMLEWMYSGKNLKAQIENGQKFTIIYLNEEAIGYFSISEKTPQHFFLHKFYIDTSQHRKGIGNSAFEYMLKNSCPSFKTITLQVNRRNIKAVNFYFKKGFIIDRAEDFDCGGGYTMDDFFMIRKQEK
jgi:GNAT superfamily N-acetyltransferase